MQQSMQVLTSENTNKWFTPLWVIDLVRAVLPDIDLDPCTEEIPQKWINATRYYTEATNGLTRPWFGHMFINPPFDQTEKWLGKFYIDTEMDFRQKENTIKDSMILVNSNLGYKWYEKLWRKYPVCCFEKRIAFADETGYIDPSKTAKRGQTMAYYGNDVSRFIRVFSQYGRVILPVGYKINHE
jgi:hypothetical protein